MRETVAYDPSRTWIAMCFNGNKEEPLFLIRLDGEKGLKKSIQDVSNVKSIGIYRIDCENERMEKKGTIYWPETIEQGDLLIKYDIEQQTGDVELMNSDYVWSYDMRDEKPNLKKDVVDREKLRKIEEKRAEPKTIWPEEIAEELKKEIYGQEEGIQKISELVAGKLRRKNPEVEVIVLFGPTGVGKTEVGKALAPALSKLTGKEYGFQQVALNEFVGEHSVNRFFGSPAGYVGYGEKTVFDPVRKNPYHVFLLDEIEKATDRIWTGLMEAFSSGFVHMADNSDAIDLRHTIIIITSNIPIDMKEYNASSSFMKKELCRNTLADKCGHPEIAGKISHCIAFQELSSNALTDIVSKFVSDELSNYGMVLEKMDEGLMAEFKAMLRHSRYGARAVKDAVRDALTYRTVYDRNFKQLSGKKVRVTGEVENIRIEVI